MGVNKHNWVSRIFIKIGSFTVSERVSEQITKENREFEVNQETQMGVSRVEEKKEVSAKTRINNWYLNKSFSFVCKNYQNNRGNPRNANLIC
ncbi:hypothetical protein HanRHA438_Chr16g0751321 [Helianthus annuus]|nr:hypothetical protein HanRHA438_Chr16g0751321 [Helianthus annuus]